MVKEGQPDKALWEATFKEVFSSFEAGYGKSLASAEFNTPDWEYLQQVKFNSAVWSAFKQNSQIKDAARMLLDDQGKAVPWKDFRDKAMQIDDTYNKRYLQTEYNQAHNTAMQARRWRDAEKTSDLYPNMIYIAVQDGRTRATHMALHGTIRPINDPFWSKYTPPLDWGCRCTLRPTDKKTTSQPAELPSVTDGMDNNPGVDGKIFSDNHPYIKGNTDRASELMAWVGSKIKSSGEIKASFEAYSNPEPGYVKSYFDGNTGGWVHIHQDVKKSDLSANTDISVVHAQHGNFVKMRPLNKEGMSTIFLVHRPNHSAQFCKMYILFRVLFLE